MWNLLYSVFIIKFSIMEKRKMDKGDDEGRLFKKKSKGQLVVCRSPGQHGVKGKQALQETKQSFSGKAAIRKSVSSGKKQKENIEKTSSVANLHHRPNHNNRYLTEALATKTSKERHKKLIKSSLISPQRTTFHGFGRSAKGRLSLNDSKKLRNPEAGKAASTLCEQFSLQELTGARQDIQEAIKRTCMKESISKKDFLRITNQYEKLITRIVFSEMIDPHNKTGFPRETEENEESLTFRVQEGNQKASCPGLQLQDIKKLKIDDYHDEFMAHYDELSESWKRDIAAQKRY